MHGAGTTGTSRTVRPSLRDGFLGLYALSPVSRACLPPSPARRGTRLCGLSASVGAPGPHDFAVRDIVIRPLRYRVHRIPLPTSVTIAKRPSYRVRDARMIALIWVKRQCPSGCGTLARRAINFAHAQFSPPPVGFAVLIMPIALIAFRLGRIQTRRRAIERTKPITLPDEQIISADTSGCCSMARPAPRLLRGAGEDTQLGFRSAPL